MRLFNSVFLLTVSLVLSTSLLAADFCWKDSYGRGVGEFQGRVADCPPSYTNNGLTCGRGTDDILKPSILPDCPAGYTNNGLVGCGRGTHDIHYPSKLADCPSGYTNMGTYCGKGILPWEIKTKSLGSGSCPSGYFKGPLARCYKTCPAGYTNTGDYCHRPVSTLGPSAFICPSGYFKSDITQRCHQTCPAGYTNTGETCHKPISTLGMDSMVCKAGEIKKGPRCYPVNTACGPNKELDAGLCYDKCRSGFNGVGPVCWGAPPKNWVECGMGAAKDSNTCASKVFGQVTSVGQTALSVASLGSSTALTAGMSAPQKASKLAKLKQEATRLQTAFDNAKKASEKLRNAEKVFKGLNAGKKGYIASETASEAVTAEDIARAAAQIAAIVDSSGVSDTVAAYTYAKCDTVINQPAPDQDAATPPSNKPIQATNNIDVSLVESSGANFVKTGPDTWLENGKRRFKELGRDEWSVYLQANDLANNGWAKLQLDLFTKQVKYSDSTNTTQRVIYTILKSNSTR